MESRDLVSVSRSVFSSIGLECLRSRLGLEGSRCLSLKTLHELFFYEILQAAPWKTVLKNDGSEFSRSKRSVAKLFVMLLARWRNNLPFILHIICIEFHKKVYEPAKTAAYNL